MTNRVEQFKPLPQYIANYNFWMAGSIDAGNNIQVPWCKQLTRSVWPNGVIKLHVAASMLESCIWGLSQL